MDRAPQGTCSCSCDLQIKALLLLFLPLLASKGLRYPQHFHPKLSTAFLLSSSNTNWPWGSPETRLQIFLSFHGQSMQFSESTQFPQRYHDEARSPQMLRGQRGSRKGWKSFENFPYTQVTKIKATDKQDCQELDTRDSGNCFISCSRVLSVK